jgi:hypothetical protein
MKTILNLTAWNGTMETSDKDLDQNPMGLVKFMFPNSNAIYLHDTPIKVYLNLTVHLVMGVSIWTKPRNWHILKRGPELDRRGYQ